MKLVATCNMAGNPWVLKVRKNRRVMVMVVQEMIRLTTNYNYSDHICMQSG